MDALSLVAPTMARKLGDHGLTLALLVTPIQEEMASDSSFDINEAYVISQVAHITYNKDHHKIL